jgi:hypothetical protein
MKHLILLFTIGFLLVVSACHDDTGIDQPTIRQAEGFFIVNEGTFNFGNGSVSYYNFETGEISHDLFKNANGHVAGDVLQDLYIFNGKGYLVLNNSGYVEVVDITSFESEGIIQPFDSPRFFLPVSEDKAYLSDLYSNSIQVVDINNNTQTNSISMPFWTETMVNVDDQVFVASPWDIRLNAHNHIYVLDANSDVLIDSIQTGYDPVTIALNGDNKLWVYCRGAEELSEPAGLYCVNTTTMEVERSFDFLNYDLGFGTRLAFSPNGEILYYLKQDVYKFALNDSALPTEPLIEAAGKTLYSLAVNPVNGSVIVGDAIDYAQKGKVYIYKSNGELSNEVEAGVIPSQIVFY